MLSKEDFIFTVGYDGPSAVVDRQAKKRYSAYSTKELAEKGLFRNACASAIWSKNPQELELVTEIYNKASNSDVHISQIERLLGVFPVDVNRCIVI